MPENCAAIIDTLIEQRKEKGMTQAQLAEATGINRAMLSRLESEVVSWKSSRSNNKKIL